MNSTKSNHVPDEQLIFDLDGELSTLHKRQVQHHLQSCWMCRSRQAELSQSISTFVGRYRKRFDRPLPSADAPRRMLKARMDEHLRSTRSTPCRWLSAKRICASVFAVGLLLVGWFIVRRLLPSARSNQVNQEANLRPDPRLSPGSADAVSRERVCEMKSLDGGRLAGDVARRVFQRYGITKPAVGEYEIDFVVPPALGGKQNVENLWPQPYGSGAWNSHTKDALEERLGELVCSGQLSAVDAQAALSNDWVDAYRKYFRSDRPLVEHVAFAKDRPWPFSMRGER